MAESLDYVTIREHSFSRGIDQRSAESELAEGFCEDILNADVVQGKLAKRKGYELTAKVPLRVFSVTGLDATSLLFTLASSVDLSQIWDIGTTNDVYWVVYGRIPFAGASSPLGNSAKTYNIITSMTLVSANSFSIVGCTVAAQDIGATYVPQLDLYGITDAVLTTGFSPNWITSLDGYSNVDGSFLVAGHGGILYQQSPVLQNKLHPVVRAEANACVIGPAFWGTGDTPALTRGWLSFDGGESHGAYITSAQWISGNTVEYALSVPNAVINGNLSDILKLGEDYLTISNSFSSELNGTYPITAASLVGSVLTIACTNTNIVDDRFNTGATNMRAWGEVYTDCISVSSNSFLDNDIVNPYSFTVLNSQPTYVQVSGVMDICTFTGGTFYGTRTSDVMFLRDSFGNMGNNGLVAGDVVWDDNQVATCRIVAANTLGVEFERAITYTDDSNNSESLYLYCRMFSSEAPDSSFTKVSGFVPQPMPNEGYSDQSFKLTALSQNNLYLVDESNLLTKFTGQNTYQASLPPWQMQSVAYVDVDNADKIDFENYAITANLSGTGFVISTTNATTLSALKAYAIDNKVWIYDSVSKAGVMGYITNTLFDDTNVRADITTTVNVSGISNLSILKPATFKYYVRLSHVDYNNNRVVTRAVGVEDLSITLLEPAAVKLKLLNMPPVGIYDYDNISVEIFRTQANVFGTYFLLATLPVTFNEYDLELLYTDAAEDSILVTSSLDVVSSNLTGVELGSTWDTPPQAKAITSANNSLVLGNLSGLPELAISLEKDSLPALSDYSKLCFILKNTPVTESAPTNCSTGNMSYAICPDTEALTADSITAGTGYIDIVFDIADVKSGTDYLIEGGSWLYLKMNAVDATNSLIVGWWQVNSVVAEDGSNATVRIYNNNIIGSETIDETLIDIYSCPSDWLVAGTNNSTVPIPETPGLELAYVNFGTTANFFYLLSMAINSTMCKADQSAVREDSSSVFPSFTPWAFAFGGNLYKSNSLFIQSYSFSPLYAKFVESSTSGFSLYLEGYKQAALNSGMQAYQPFLPSRLVVSYPNYPELFDNVYADQPDSSHSVIDINSDDGQAITAIAPFFGDSTFDQSKTAGAIVVFKQNSIYLVDLTQKELYRKSGGTRGLANPIQKLETFGVGCFSSRSVALSKNALFFAHNSGIYAIRRDLSVDYVGRFVDRIWQQQVDLEQPDLMHGYTDPIKNRYLLSYPSPDSTSANNVLAYHHREEFLGATIAQQMKQQETGAGYGAWTRYDSYMATKWSNLDGEEYFGDTGGNIWTNRNSGSAIDFRDDNAGIGMQVMFRAMNFTDAGIRKQVKYAIGYYRVTQQTNDIALQYSTELSNVWNSSQAFSLDYNNPDTDLSDYNNRKVMQVRHSFETDRCTYFQLKLVENGIDEGLEFVGWDYRVRPNDDKGIPEAAETLAGMGLI